MARIGNSVYDDICPGDPTCRMFGFDRAGVPTPMMANSLLYKLHSHNIRPGVRADPSRFQEVYTSKYGKVRIFKVLSISKESREWAADPSNRRCDAPGSWYCSGRYPPALEWLEKKKKAFRQLEDFNRGGRDEKYYEEYMARMEGRKPSESSSSARGADRAGKADKKVAGKKDPRADVLGRIKKLVSEGSVDEMAHMLATEPDVVKLRTADGRGPLWWAYEAGQTDMAALLLAAGADPEATDSEGMRPLDLKL
jgi:dolichyl-diphosphooligosaccharide--protein glycosyltransferase